MPAHRYHPITAALTLALLVGACQGQPNGGPSTDGSAAATAPAIASAATTAPPSLTASVAATATAVVVSARPSGELPARPPEASLAADGGDRVAGQLGTYTWADGGSDSVWLQGAPLLVGHDEPLTVMFRPLVPVSSWRARLVRAGADGPTGARTIGLGTSGVVGFRAPVAGRWTVELTVTFVGQDQASYAWLLTST